MNNPLMRILKHVLASLFYFAWMFGASLQVALKHDQHASFGQKSKDTAKLFGC